MRRWYLLSVGAAAIVGVAVGVAWHTNVSGSAARLPMLPTLNGQATWRAGDRPAPGFVLHDQHGRQVSLQSLRGSTIALTFLDSLCKAACPVEGRMLAAAIRQVAPGSRPRLVVVSVNPAGDTPASVAKAAHKWTLPANTAWLLGTHAELARVWDAYQITVEPMSGEVVHSTAVYLIDKRGNERAGFLLPFIPGLVAGDLRKLAAEPA